MKDFAKSIVCNSVTEKEFNTEADLRRWCMDHNYTYTPVGGGYYRLEDDKPGSKRPDLEAHVKAGNSKVGNRTASEIEKEIAEVESSIDSHHRAGENPPKTLEDRLKKLKTELANAKTGNSTEKLFYGLSKDAEKEEEKSDEALDELKKTGNASTGDFTALINKAMKIAQDKPEKAGRINQIVSFLKSAHNLPTDRWQYHIDRIGKELAELGNSKVGNASEVANSKTGNTKVKKTLFKSLSTPTTWTPGINGRPIAGAPEFKGTFAKDEAEKWTDKWIKDHGFEVENKVGNANYRYKEYIISKSDEDGEIIVYKPNGRDVAFRGTKSEAMAKDWIDHHAKTGNSKTENGLARARNAIKKN